MSLYIMSHQTIDIIPSIRRIPCSAMHYYSIKLNVPGRTIIGTVYLAVYPAMACTLVQKDPESHTINETKHCMHLALMPPEDRPNNDRATGRPGVRGRSVSRCQQKNWRRPPLVRRPIVVRPSVHCSSMVSDVYERTLWCRSSLQFNGFLRRSTPC